MCSSPRRPSCTFVPSPWIATSQSRSRSNTANTNPEPKPWPRSHLFGSYPFVSLTLTKEIGILWPFRCLRITRGLLIDWGVMLACFYSKKYLPPYRFLLFLPDLNVTDYKRKSQYQTKKTWVKTKYNFQIHWYNFCFNKVSQATHIHPW